MSEFDTFFDNSLGSDQSETLLANLGTLVDDHLDRVEGGEPFGMNAAEMENFKILSAVPLAIGGGASFRIDRATSDLMAVHGVEAEVFLDHVAERTVVDIGPGLSPFLDDCRARGAQTTALDINPRVVQFARSKGHVAHTMEGGRLRLGPNSVDVIHSSHAVPFTCRPDEAIGLAGDSFAALKRDGYGLVHPVVPPMAHRLFEELMGQENPLEFSVQEATGVPLVRSLALTAFCAQLLYSRDQGEIDVIASRSVIDDSRPGTPGSKNMTLPSSVIFRKTA